MAEQINDAIRHLEKDMVSILEVMQDSNTTEVILNPYRRTDGSYEGHILVDQHGIGLHNLTNDRTTEYLQPSPLVGDVLICKYAKHNCQQLFWLKIGSFNNGSYDFELTDTAIDNLVPQMVSTTANTVVLQLIRRIGFCLKSYFIKDRVLQNSNPILNALVENLPLYYSSLEVRPSFASIQAFVAKINHFLNDSCEIYLQIEVVENPQLFRPYPPLIILSDLVKMTAAKAETIISVLASITGKFIHAKSQVLECQIPKYGHRFTGVIPPAVIFPAFCIRKHAAKIYSLDDFVTAGVMQQSSADTIRAWVRRKFNILIAGGTGSGKTTLANAILAEIAKSYPDSRVLIIEDVPELQFNSSRSVAFTVNEFFSMYDALRATLRFKPERIVMGEVRGAEAYTLLKAWNTGHPGGVATIHANGVNEALYRFESCIRDHPQVKINRQEIGFTINGIISIQNLMIKEIVNGEYVNTTKRRVTALRQILQYDPDKDIYQDIIFDKVENDFD